MHSCAITRLGTTVMSDSKASKSARLDSWFWRRITKSSLLSSRAVTAIDRLSTSELVPHTIPVASSTPASCRASAPVPSPCTQRWIPSGLGSMSMMVTGTASESMASTSRRPKRPWPQTIQLPRGGSRRCSTWLPGKPVSQPKSCEALGACSESASVSLKRSKGLRMWRVPKEAMLAEVAVRSARHSAGRRGASRRAAIAIARLVASSLVSAITPMQLGCVSPANLSVSGLLASAHSAGTSAA